MVILDPDSSLALSGPRSKRFARHIKFSDRSTYLRSRSSYWCGSEIYFQYCIDPPISWISELEDVKEIGEECSSSFADRCVGRLRDYSPMTTVYLIARQLTRM